MTNQPKVTDLFKHDPETLTDEQIEAIIDYYREIRERLQGKPKDSKGNDDFLDDPL